MSDAVTTTKRPRGRPPKGEQAMTRAEHAREYRKRSGISSVPMPKDVRDLLTQVRDATGLSKTQVMREALRRFAAT